MTRHPARARGQDTGPGPSPEGDAPLHGGAADAGESNRLLGERIRGGITPSSSVSQLFEEFAGLKEEVGVLH